MASISWNSKRVLLVSWILITSYVFKIQTATEYNRYLVQIFKKYGNGGAMTFEGLEHLMHNLGLGQIEFDPAHTLNEHRPHRYLATVPEKGLNIESNVEHQTIELLSNNRDVQFIIKKEIIENAPDLRQLRIENVTNGPEKSIKEEVKADSIERNDVILEFKEMHDPKHRHPRGNDENLEGPPVTENVCLSPKSLLRLVVDHSDLHEHKSYKIFTSSSTSAVTNAQHDHHDVDKEYNNFINSVHLTQEDFMKLCPVLLSQIDQQVCRMPASLQRVDDAKEMFWNAWIYASISIFILSSCGLLSVLLFPLMKLMAYQQILNFFVAVAVGTLSGDALMHLLPHALIEHHHQPHHSDDDNHSTHMDSAAESNKAVWICACAFFTATFMYMVENVIPLINGKVSSSHQHHHHHHQRDECNKQTGNVNPINVTTNESVNTTQTVIQNTPNKESRELNVMLNESAIDLKKPSKPLSPLALMVIIGDGLHNLTDGLAIGAAFAADPVTGLATAFAVLCHELPHELGDFAMLLQTGVSMQRAICLNIISSVLSVIGMVIGILIAGLHAHTTQWIYAATAGSFLYIAFADLVPAMATESRKNLKTSLIQAFGIFVGGVIMIVIAVNEHDLEELFQ